MDPGETFFDGLIDQQNLAPDDDASQASGVGEVQDDDDGQYSEVTVDEDDERSIALWPSWRSTRR